MALEIERKFLVKEYIDFAKMSERSVEIRQGYLSANPDATVRVRTYGEEGFITVKSRTVGAVRHEWEYKIPIRDALEMLCLPGVRHIEKIRHYINYEGSMWEIDVFRGALTGLILGEIELPSDDAEFAMPPFVGKEVTHDVRYFNSSLMLNGVPEE